MKDKNELLPCPFCGSRKISAIYYQSYYQIACGTCDSKTGQQYSLEIAVNKWNQRKGV
jgi:Lar family restriction alleviation protein